MNRDHRNEAERGADRREQRGVAKGWRLSGLVLVLIGAAALVYAELSGPGPGILRNAGWGMMALGWLLLIVGVVLRVRHHRARSAG